MVIEAGVSAPDSDSIKPELPPELIAFLQKSIDEEDPDAPPTLGYLLGWMSVFDLFVDAVSDHIQDRGGETEGPGDDHLSLPSGSVPYV